MEILTDLWEMAMISLVCGLVAIVSFAVLETGEFRKARKIFWVLFLISISILAFFWFNFFFPELFSRTEYINQSDLAIIVCGWGALVSYFVFLFFIWVWLENKYNKQLEFPFSKSSRIIGLIITILSAALILFLSFKVLELRDNDELCKDDAVVIEEVLVQ